MKRAERQQLSVLIEEVQVWIKIAEDVRQLAAHSPLSGPIWLADEDRDLLVKVEQASASGDAQEASRLTQATWLAGNRRLQPAYDAAARLDQFRNWYCSIGAPQRLVWLRDGLLARTVAERDDLAAMLSSFRATGSAASKMLHDASHLPITRSGALGGDEQELGLALIKLLDEHHDKAMMLLDGSCCADTACPEAHRSAHAIREAHAVGLSLATTEKIITAAKRLAVQLADERAWMPQIVSELNAWRSAGQQGMFDAEHMPLTRGGLPVDYELSTIRTFVSEYDAIPDAATALPVVADCNAGHCSSAHESMARVATLHASLSVAEGERHTVLDAAERLAAARSDERERLRDALDDLEGWQNSASLALHKAAHLPLTRSGALSEVERTTAGWIQSLVQRLGPNSRTVLDSSSCDADDCDRAHQAATQLYPAYLDLLQTRGGEAVLTAGARIETQLQDEREKVATLHIAVAHWPDRINQILTTRQNALDEVEIEVQRLVGDSSQIKIGRMKIRLLPLHRRSESFVASLTILRDSTLTSEDKTFLDESADLAQRFLKIAESSVGSLSGWECEADDGCESAHQVVSHTFLTAKSIESQLIRLSVNTEDTSTDFDELLDPTLRLLDYLPSNYTLAEKLPDYLLDDAWDKLPNIINAYKIAEKAAVDAHAAADKVRTADIAEALKAMDLEVLRKAAPQGKLRTGPLQDYKLHNVWDVLRFQDRRRLKELPGLGDASAQMIEQASLRLFEAVREETPVRIDVKRKGKATATLLASLQAWDNVRRFKPTEDEVALATGLSRLAKKARNIPILSVLVAVEGVDQDCRPSVSNVLGDALSSVTSTPGNTNIWTDFLSRPADYFGMLLELGFLTEDEKSMHGDLPQEIVEAVRAKELRRDNLTASLRAYQSFGARFALVQEKVLIGDEMGLGKTIEALAVFAHLRARGQTHFLVVCPAAVVSNWIRETAKHTTLEAVRLHGPLWERNYAARAWIRNGGVAVTTYDLLPWAQEQVRGIDLGCVILDEAHYIKNPRAKRSLAAADVIDSTKYAILMTGTPLENSVAEFRNLIGYIRPDLAEDAPEYLAAAFRKHIAPAYLRRNQEDVLTELPEMVEVDEWMGMSVADEKVYRRAVEDGQFMLMRRAAMLSEQSMKVDRLLEIAGEAEANGRRVIVFSYFREVLNEVARLLPGEVFGPLTGSIPAADRQMLVDRFSQAGHGAVLVAQITAGGVGLNIQSASVVVICEPQIKPTMESQAIARAHRMGQTDTVQVHRLLTEDSVDERIRDILKDKRQLFDEFARDSVIAKQAPDAVDVSESELARMVVAAERERLSIAAQ